MRPAWRAPIWLPPAAREVQVWRASAGPALLRRAGCVLSQNEIERAARMRAGPPREEFAAARGLLRMLLGFALSRDPASIKLTTGAHGKPRLAVECGLEFNVAHSQGAILVALSTAGEIGVDVESVDRAVEAAELARAHFTATEADAIMNAGTAECRAELFFRCWTRKEAVVKADGRGLQLPLKELEVRPHDRAEELAVSLPSTGVMYVTDLPMQPGFCAALAMAERDVPRGLFDVGDADLDLLLQ